MKKIGLFFGSFNPVHVGHMIIANYMVEHTDLDQVWMVVTPHNPHKLRKTLAPDYDRLHLVQLAIGNNLNIQASDIEFKLPKPSYTVDTLAYLREKHPKKDFTLIMGGDNLATLHKWKNYSVLLDNYNIYVYSRPDYELGDLQDHPSVTIWKAPLMQISASYIREQVKNGKSIEYLVTPEVYDYIDSSNLYRL